MILRKAAREKESCTKSRGSERPGALQKALSFLTYRSHSEAELVKKLGRYDFPADEVKTAIARCREYGYLNDDAFALERARALLSRGRAVGPKIMEDLRRRGIEEDVARKAVDQACEEHDPEDILAAVFEKKFAGFSFPKARDSEKKRVINYFLRRGFSLATVLAFLKGERS